ncbi:MAG: molybdate ABC transporter substrate-binding protein [Actinomycetota bacterium]|nr:molybdate ABC transporter substrate-binding protein [Actinomycetota bacterium]
MRRGLLRIPIVLVLVLVPAGCGGGKPTLKVSAAASLKTAFTAYGASFAAARAAFSFAGSDELAAQIRQGVKPDVFASANTKLPDALHAAGRVEPPVPFAANRLVLATPAGGSVRSLSAVARPGVSVVIGAASVPIGAYTRQVLGRLGAGPRRAILHNVRSEEPDVGGIVAKLTQGAADAGFVYATDVRAAGGRLRAIALPPRSQPRVVYAAAVVTGAPHPAEARAFVRGLLTGTGQRALRAAGFEPPPR